MKFTFPDIATIHNGAIKNFKEGSYPIDIDILHPTNNIIALNKVNYYYTYLGDQSGNKGGNSIVLKLYISQNIDDNRIENGELQYGEPDLILKISKNPIPRFGKKTWQKRFEKEVEALMSCKNAKFQNVITIFHSGECQIKNFSKPEKYDRHLFYTMEYAQHDLKSYIEQKHFELGTEEKIALCLSLCEGLKELYSLGFYHRDIKPDNIFMIDNQWKIRDLGLLGERDQRNPIDNEADLIGPRGWMSPESMNKYLCEGKGFNFNFNVLIDHQSDIFQLGKIFWYIFQHNAPIGCVSERDFLVKNSQVYSIIKTMLNNSKAKRYKHIDEIILLLKKCEEKSLRQLVA